MTDERVTPSTIRDRQRELVREAILETVADHVARTRTFDFSVAAIAKAAGVSLRTVYNHFGSREGLLAAAEAWLDQEFARRQILDIPESVDAIPDAVRHNWRLFEEVADLIEAYARLDSATAQMPGSARRTDAILNLLRERFPHLTERQAFAAMVAIRQTMSSRTWFRYTREFGLTTDEAAETAGWLLDELIGALERGSVPLEYAR